MNLFSLIVGNDQIKNFLINMVRHEKIGNSFLFAGADGIGKSLFASALAKYLLCGEEPSPKFDQGNHPDFHQYYPEGKIGMHSIDTMRRFKQEVYLPPYESRRQIFVIHEADRMLPYSANALLKSFEEPPQNTIIILLSSSPSSFLPTVLSRCRKIFFHPLSREQIAHLLEQRGMDPDKALSIAGSSQGSIKRALRLAETGEDPLIEKLLTFLRQPDWPYEDIREVCSSIGGELEALRETVEQETTEEMGGASLKELSATQREQVEKEIQGVATMRYQGVVETLLQTILSWSRDAELCRCGGDPKYLMLPVSSEKLPEKISLFKVNKMIDDARLAIRRFIPVASALETLFLKLVSK